MIVYRLTQLASQEAAKEGDDGLLRAYQPPRQRVPSTSSQSGEREPAKHSKQLSTMLKLLYSLLSPQTILNNDWAQQSCS
jgi:hypothetical protein